MFKLENSQNYTANSFFAELQLIQNCIDEMRINSRSFKSYAIFISIISILSGFLYYPLITVAFISVLTTFWMMDCYYLRLERAYRKLYNDFRIKRLGDENNYTLDSFDLNPVNYLRTVDPIHKIAFTISEVPFYGCLIALLIIITII